MKKSNLITEISLEDFLKLNLTGYEHRKHFYNKDGVEITAEETGEIVIDTKGKTHWFSYTDVYSKLIWDKINLNEVVKENIEWSEQEGFKNRCICVAIHTEPTEEEINEIMNRFNYIKSYKEKSELKKYTYNEAYESLLFEYSYLDKFITHSGHQTYLIRCDVPHLYSEKRKFCTHDDYFEVPKSETKAVYLVRY